MSGIWGKNLQINIFGESHGQSIGIVINGLPAGVEIDFEKVEKQMARRAPNGGIFSTPRKEEDKVNIVSGYFENKTTGCPLCAFINNTNTKSTDYSATKDLVRPSHSDYGYWVKSNGFNDYRGGGHSSGRITAPLVFCGAICQQILEKQGIYVGSHIKSVSNIEDKDFELTDGQLCFEKLLQKELPVLDDNIIEPMTQKITWARSQGDSVGGIIETNVVGINAGYGDPFFDSIESKISSIIFSVPAVKGIEFGKGFEISKLTGSQANDQFCIKDEKVQTMTNNNGGILGGISNGMPINFKVAIKPTASIFVEQNTVNVKTMEEEIIKIKGRHDPCIVVRAVPVIEAVTAIAICDILMENKK